MDKKIERFLKWPVAVLMGLVSVAATYDYFISQARDVHGLVDTILMWIITSWFVLWALGITELYTDPPRLVQTF
jgi:hypothetical protein